MHLYGFLTFFCSIFTDLLSSQTNKSRHEASQSESALLIHGNTRVLEALLSGGELNPPQGNRTSMGWQTHIFPQPLSFLFLFFPFISQGNSIFQSLWCNSQIMLRLSYLYEMYRLSGVSSNQGLYNISSAANPWGILEQSFFWIKTPQWLFSLTLKVIRGSSYLSGGMSIQLPFNFLHYIIFHIISANFLAVCNQRVSYCLTLKFLSDT